MSDTLHDIWIYKILLNMAFLHLSEHSYRVG